MPGFLWRGRNSRGELVQGRMEADTGDTVAERLLNLDITPVEIQKGPEKQEDAPAFGQRLGLNNPDIDDLILFSRQMHTLTKSGVPIIRGLNSVRESTHHPVLRRAIADTIESLESGRALAAGLARNPAIFSALYTNIIRVGEASGNLEGAFLQMAGYLELDRDFRSRLKAALRYPAMVITAMVVAIAILMVWVIPVFAELFASRGADLPLPTRVIISASGVVTRWWWLILLALAAVLLSFRHWLSTDRGRYRWHRIKLLFPVIGTILKNGTMARFARSFAVTSRAGVPLIQALTLVSRAVENDYIAQGITDMRTGIEHGESLSRTAGATGLFSPLVLQMLSVGEETGDVDGMMIETAEFHEREVDYALRNLSAWIEPVLLVFMAVLVMILALGVFLPMWDLGSVMLD